jgi:hypothetical protein
MPTTSIICGSDPAFKLTCRRLPDPGRDLCFQSTLSRVENAPLLRDVITQTYIAVGASTDIRPAGQSAGE